jgi:methionyl-tRNA formyltransferase
MISAKKILFVTDNGLLYSRIKEVILADFPNLESVFEFRRSKSSTKERLYTDGIENLEVIDVKIEYQFIIDNYEMVISLHCKQIFPVELVKNMLCINIHPGLNPYNRGWYPQVFAIINHTKLGATIHIMDEEVDHGPIIARKEVPVESYYTSKEAYEKVLDAEVDLFKNNIQSIIDGSFTTNYPEFEGDYHSIDDFNKLCMLDMNENLTLGEAVDKLRALSHGNYKNAYFFDNKGNRIYLKIDLSKD